MFSEATITNTFLKQLYSCLCKYRMSNRQMLKCPGTSGLTGGREGVLNRNYLNHRTEKGKRAWFWSFGFLSVSSRQFRLTSYFGDNVAIYKATQFQNFQNFPHVIVDRLYKRDMLLVKQ